MRRVYDAVDPDDGARVLVDRLWPRGLSKEAARLDEWLKDVAPSNELRKWYGHRAEAYEEFAERYRAELADEPGSGALERLRELAGGRAGHPADGDQGAGPQPCDGAEGCAAPRLLRRPVRACAALPSCLCTTADLHC